MYVSWAWPTESLFFAAKVHLSVVGCLLISFGVSLDIPLHIYLPRYIRTLARANSLYSCHVLSGRPKLYSSDKRRTRVVEWTTKGDFSSLEQRVKRIGDV